jgi:hypothetical protein
VIVEEAIVAAMGGAATTNCSPHLEIVVVAFAPFEMSAISLTGRVTAPLETISVFATSGVELVAEMLHFRTYDAVPPETTEVSLVPLAFGSRALTEDIVRSDLRFAYWLVPAFQDSQSFPTFFASAELMPKMVVSPEELPLT